MLNASIDGQLYQIRCYVVNNSDMHTKLLIGCNFLRTVDYAITPGNYSNTPGSELMLASNNVSGNVWRMFSREAKDGIPVYEPGNECKISPTRWLTINQIFTATKRPSPGLSIKCQ
ncbi:hypothetical protein DMENIID0001_037930 [Sergentomyia squamirostris]